MFSGDNYTAFQAKNQILQGLNSTWEKIYNGLMMDWTGTSGV